MKNYKCLIGLILFLVFTISCEEIPEPSDPCDDNEWATAIKNGEDYCMGKVEVTYWNANTQSAKIGITAGNESIAPFEISATFSIPVEGIELNKAYPLLEGEFFGADPITEGSLTLLVVDPPAQCKAGCFAGTFNLKSQSGGITTFDYTNGRFVYYRGTVSQSDFGNAENTGCNPFN